MQTLTLAEQPPLVIACSTTRGITRDQVAAVRDRYAREPALYEGLFDEIDDISKATFANMRALSGHVELKKFPVPGSGTKALRVLDHSLCRYQLY